LTGALIPIIFTIIWTFFSSRRDRINKEKESCENLIFALNKEVNSLLNYKLNLEKQIKMLYLQKTNKEDLENTFVFKFAPTLINNFTGLNISDFNGISSGFIRQQIVFCKNDSDNLVYNSKLISSQIENLFTTNDKLIELAVKHKNSQDIIILPEQIRKTFDGGIDQLILNLKTTLSVLENHNKDLVTLLATVVKYMDLHFNFVDLWKYKFSSKNLYKIFPWNAFYKQDKNIDSFTILYKFFKEEGESTIKEIQRPK
jgi:hypothetical protein